MTAEPGNSGVTPCWELVGLGVAIALSGISAPLLAPASTTFLLQVCWYVELGAWSRQLGLWSLGFGALHWLFYCWTQLGQYPWPLWVTCGAVRARYNRTWQGWWLQLTCISWSIGFAMHQGCHGPLLVTAAGCVSWLAYLRTWWASSSGSPGSGYRILMLTLGTRGDVQPVVQLGKSLKASGHQVCIICSLDQLGFCASSGIRALPGLYDLGFMFRILGGFSHLSLRFALECMPYLWLNTCWELVHPITAVCRAFRPDVVLYDVSAKSGGAAYELVTGVPAIPVCYTACHLKAADPWRLPRRPCFLATSPQLEHATEDWPLLHQTGAWLPRAAPQPAELAALTPLAAFLDAGPPPVAIGWGSMLARGLSPEAMLHLALEASLRAGKRAVVLGGWAGIDKLGRECSCMNFHSVTHPVEPAIAEHARENCYFIGSAPHFWLLPRCCCFVHHGGSGTVHAAVEAGVPSVITPITFDQPHWVSIVEGTEVGIGFHETLPTISAERLANAISEAEKMRPMVQSWSQRLKMEKDSVTQAADLLVDFIRKAVVTGDWQRQFVEHHGLSRFCYV